jgi:branched-chain amino acid transport system permease protein
MTDVSYRTIAVVVAALALLPLVLSGNVMVNFLAMAMIVTLAAQGWNILGGFGGQFSFGHAAFFGFGAYTMAILQVRFGVNAWFAIPLAIAAGALVGLFIGVLSFRANLRGSYFALVTLAFAEVFRILVNAWSFAGGAAGILVPINKGAINGQFADQRVFYWFALGCVAIVLFLTAYLLRTRFGAHLIAVRENEDAAMALGANTLKVKLGAIALSGGVTALAGALYTMKFLYLDAKIAFGAWISVEALLGAIVGGLGTVLGPVVGTLALLGLGEVTKHAVTRYTGGTIAGIDLAVFGALLILCVAFAPRGVLGVVDRVRAKYVGSRA